MPSSLLGLKLPTFLVRSVASRRKTRRSGSTSTMKARSVERYSSQLRGATQGKGEFSMKYKNHMQVLPNVQVELQDAYRKFLPHNNKSRCGISLHSALYEISSTYSNNNRRCYIV
ncbi:hypothetical protein EDB83DRAFT_1012629 [Lactarius deliciosus]|nr:hypothetical protein EDB83DRAFT_1012629 [Lactarius deliciosus]